ncbi:Uma2 family endonuclease [Sphaerospermopsis sp. LEGE 00249]|uniref:Uma2 family endonuclease n=1 Tax=Sphaerospermopsis sp. LEGE 00249 TaxID=1380707 RepID=UPI00164E5CE3|nr:Uma2 family endonuclease [Sphaerospermopsis sp. LEGE 00249]MBC5794946.1 Uma2 family endonuclease [Sphaerospermopsis sp. LEGE 00249]
MVVSASTTNITWELLPEDFILDDEPVDNVNQPSLAAALTESLELAGKLPETAIATTNYGICATVNGKFVIKAPDWAYVPQITVPREQIQRRYTPHKQGQIPVVVMEFLSDTEGSEYSSKRTYPPGKWFFYEQVLQVPNYIIFQPDTGELEVHNLQETGSYKLRSPDDNNRYWLAEMELFIGVWQGKRENRQGYWLRWWGQDGNLLLWGSELVQQERLAKEVALKRLEELEKRLRDAGISD